MAASQFTVYKKKEEDLDEYSDKGGARKKKARAQGGHKAPAPGGGALLLPKANCETGDR